jgi:hypothetical protein
MKSEIALIRVNYDSHIISPQLGLGYLSSLLKSQFVSNFSKKSYKEPEYLSEGLSRNDLLKAQSKAFIKFFLRPKTFIKAVSYLRPRQMRHLVKRLFDYRIIPN